MQQVLGVSFQNTHIKTPSFPEASTVTEPIKPMPSKGQGSPKIDFNQIFNKQLPKSEVKEITQVDSENIETENIETTTLINGESFPVQLSEIGNQLSEFESLDELKKELEAQGFSPKFFDIGLDAQNHIEIQPTGEDDLQNASMQNYSSILVMQINIDPKQSESLETVDTSLMIEGIASQTLNTNELDASNQQTLTNPPAILQWLRANMSDGQSVDQSSRDLMKQLLGEGISPTPDRLFNEDAQMDFDPELKVVLQSELTNILNEVAGSSFMDISNGENSNVALVVISPDAQSDLDLNALATDNISLALVDEPVPAHVATQLLSQAVLSKEESEFSSEFLKTKNVSKDESKLTDVNKGLDDSGDVEDESQYEELELDSKELDLDEPVKTKRAMQADLSVQTDKTLSAKPGQIELPAINLSDAKSTSNAIKSIPTAAADLMQSILPEKQAIKLTEELGSRVMMLHNQKMTTGFIRLDPPELGALEIKIETQGDEARVSIVTSQVNIKEALESQSNRLREMLLEQGFTSVDVDVTEQGASNSNGESNAKEDGDLDAENTEAESVVTQEKSVHLLDQFV